MTIGILVAMLLAAFLHAGWNALIKTGVNPQSSIAIMSLCQGVLGLFLVIWLPLPTAEVWPWLIASGVIHMFYQLFLAYAYEQGDLSRVYPLARGCAPLIVVVFGAIALEDHIRWTEYLGILFLGGGIILMAGGVFSSGESRRLLPFALGAACATAGYTVVDGLGARVSGAPFQFVCWLMFLTSVMILPPFVFLRGTGILRVPAKTWGIGLVAAFASLASYAVAVWAMTKAPIALVAAMRETSILFAVLIGWLIFGEKLDKFKATAALLIVTGVVLTRL